MHRQNAFSTKTFEAMWAGDLHGENPAQKQKQTQN